MKVDFFVSGNPIPKERPRFGRNGNVYTPKKTKAWETLVGLHGKVARPAGWPLDAKYKVTIKVRPYRRRGRKGDLDNFLKSILDGLEGILWDNDTQVDEVSAGWIEFPVGVHVTAEVMQ